MFQQQHPTLSSAVVAVQQQYQINPVSKGDARCKRCGIEYLKGELNAQHHCHHCADELGETHPFFTPPQPAERVALTTPVKLFNGVEAVVCGHSTCDCQNYQVTWFDRHFWQVRHQWVHRSKFEVQKQTAEAVASAVA